jgi:hypothetical protein
MQLRQSMEHTIYVLNAVITVICNQSTKKYHLLKFHLEINRSSVNVSITNTTNNLIRPSIKPKIAIILTDCMVSRCLMVIQNEVSMKYLFNLLWLITILGIVALPAIMAYVIVHFVLKFW